MQMQSNMEQRSRLKAQIAPPPTALHTWYLETRKFIIAGRMEARSPKITPVVHATNRRMDMYPQQRGTTPAVDVPTCSLPRRTKRQGTVIVTITMAIEVTTTMAITIVTTTVTKVIATATTMVVAIIITTVTTTVTTTIKTVTTTVLTMVTPVTTTIQPPLATRKETTTDKEGNLGMKLMN